MRLRLATWNCRQGLDRKRDALERLGADVVVLQECTEAPALSRELGVSFLWRGDYARKGLAVAAFDGWTVEPLEPPVDLPWVLPVRLLDPSGVHRLDLLNVWTVVRKGRPGYVAQCVRLVDVWADAIPGRALVLAGDFNCSIASGLGPTLERLEELGVRSAYHAHHAILHGEEPHETLRWIARGSVPNDYHCDFVLLADELLGRVTGVEVGSMAEWVETKLSDHCPIVVDLEFE